MNMRGFPEQSDSKHLGMPSGHFHTVLFFISMEEQMTRKKS